ncbi:hypothetical protein RhiirA5_359712 [Rhizophagus irregularis]|uniref:Uncharacterized protein n=2 Tax=Rhizophagus irregularis TaxID=588596 RepID=A0A2I1EHD4_9GLOM|nr:hypothetical protein RhiirA5_359712 [Rhizophagus irregularis]GBC31532.1 hypothetical protein RIR_jg32028.t1 [Rhizophagus irregularis DAOM 181602=DAOM 197198]PKC61291.1 hypothetical protein RhiirA1_425003 [Rhizophagus irregularis]PKK68913.1 hypothetical protein RhiirC2_749334 [Rhizophagus irregularis]PKY21536.1 hypothetical protein RhiirB3_409547 [Rhizophagus irregularis]
MSSTGSSGSSSTLVGSNGSARSNTSSRSSNSSTLVSGSSVSRTTAVYTGNRYGGGPDFRGLSTSQTIEAVQQQTRIRNAANQAANQAAQRQ